MLKLLIIEKPFSQSADIIAFGQCDDLLTAQNVAIRDRVYEDSVIFISDLDSKQVLSYTLGASGIWLINGSHTSEILAYSEDCKDYEKPWELWEFKSRLLRSAKWHQCESAPTWSETKCYRRKLLSGPKLTV